MDLTTYQLWERRNSADQITRPGAFGKNSPLTNGQNTGILDYIANDLDVLYGEQQNFVGLVWHASTTYSAGTAIIVGGGKVAKVTTAGTSGTTAPTWNVGNVTDGTVVWAVSDVTGINAATQTALDGKLSLTGGTMTGHIKINSDGYFHLQRGGGLGSGVIISDYSFASPHVLVRASNQEQTNYKDLELNSNGHLVWNDKEVERVNASGTNYIRYESGLQICWGTFNVTTSGENISFIGIEARAYFGYGSANFALAFAATPVVSIGGSDNGAGLYTTTLTGVGTTGFTAETFGANPDITCTNNYIAIGKWK